MTSGSGVDRHQGRLANVFAAGLNFPVNVFTCVVQIGSKNSVVLDGRADRDRVPRRSLLAIIMPLSFLT